MPVVVIDVDAADVELAADALWQARPSAVSETDLGRGRVRLTADVADVGGLAGRWGARVLEPDGDGYLDAWRAWARPRRVGRRFLLQPPWIGPADAAEHEVVLALDPGRSFGSGSHESTRLSLVVLEDVVAGGERVLDVGCGSGVLAVAACLLGAASVVAVDIDPAALDATRANAVANGVADQIDVCARLDEVVGDFDVVVANIRLRVLDELTEAFKARVAPSGRLVLAGLLEAQLDDLLGSYHGWVVEHRPIEGGWVATALRSP